MESPKRNIAAQPSGGVVEPTISTPPAPPDGWQDLSDDVLVSTLHDMEFRGQQVPGLGGIPLLRFLGRGGMGVVYYGIHEELNRPVAVKILPWQPGQTDEAIDRFLREGRLAAEIKSPFLVHMLDSGEDQELSYLVMEYVDGGSASEYLKTTQLQGHVGLRERDALEVAIAATRGLSELHTRDIVHRDVKPANLFMVRGRDRDSYDLQLTKLGDLGVVHAESEGVSLTESNVALGTPGFMAPEQGMDAKRAGPEADVFSMGATLYTLLRGEPPFQGDSHMAVMLATLNKPQLPIRTVRPDVSVNTAMLLQRCLAKDPEERFLDAGELLAALVQCRKGLAERPIVRSQHTPQELRTPETLSNWAIGVNGWIRLPFLFALGWLGVEQIFDPHYAGPLHRFGYWLHEMAHDLIGHFGSVPFEIIGGAVLPTSLALGLIIVCLWRRAWFAVFMSVGLLAAFLHQEAQYILTSWLPQTAAGKFEVVEYPYHDWTWILSRLDLLTDAKRIGTVIGETANMLIGLAVLSATLCLWTVFTTSRRNRPGV